MSLSPGSGTPCWRYWVSSQDGAFPQAGCTPRRGYRNVLVRQDIDTDSTRTEVEFTQCYDYKSTCSINRVGTCALNGPRHDMLNPKHGDGGEV